MRKAVALGIGVTVTVAVGHVLIVVHIVNRENEGLFALGQINVALLIYGLAVVCLDLLHHVVDIHEDIAPCVHLLHDGVKLAYRGHIEVVAVLFPVAVKGSIGVGNKAVEEYMRDMGRVLPTGALSFLRLKLLLVCRAILGVVIGALILGDQCKRLVVII